MKTTKIISAPEGIYGHEEGRFRTFYAVRNGKVLAISKDQMAKFWSVNMCVVLQRDASPSWKGHRLSPDDGMSLVNQIRGSLTNVENLIEETLQ